MTGDPGKSKKTTAACAGSGPIGLDADGSVVATPPGKGLSPRRRAGLRHTTPPLPEPCSESFKILASLISVAERFKTDLGTLRPEHPQISEVIHFLDIAQLSAEQLLPKFAPPGGMMPRPDPKG